MNKLSRVAILILLFAPGCGDTTAPDRPTTSAAAAVEREKPQAPNLPPPDVTYSIIEQDVIPGIKRSLVVRLNKRVSEEVLATIAMQLRGSDPKRYDRTFIGYYLEDAETNAGYWATSHFNPELGIRILGLTAEEEAALGAQVSDSSREVIGSWLDERPFVSNRITIFSEGGQLYMENTYQDGSSSKKELVEKRSSRGRRYDKVGGSSTGGHWILNSAGALELRDNEELIVTAKKIQGSDG